MSSKEKFYSSLTDRKISDKGYDRVLNVWKRFEMKRMKDYHNLYLKCDVLLFFKKIEIIASRIVDYVQVNIWNIWLKLGCNAQNDKN